jgi:hypothetical protein
MTTWRTHATRGLLLIALAATAPLTAAQAGQTHLAPGASDVVDTGERGNYTTMTIQNLGSQPGRVEFGAPISRTVDVPAGGQVELYGSYGRPAVQAANRGPTALSITTRYLETFHGP